MDEKLHHAIAFDAQGDGDCDMANQPRPTLGASKRQACFAGMDSQRRRLGR